MLQSDGDKNLTAENMDRCRITDDFILEEDEEMDTAPVNVFKSVSKDYMEGEF